MANVKKTVARKKPTKTAASKKSAPKPSPVEPAKKTAVLPKKAGAWRHLIWTFRFIGSHWWFFLAFTLIYTLLSFIFVHNISTDVNSVKSGLNTALGNNKALTAVGTYTLLLTSTTSGASSTTAAYQYLLFVIGSLALIWALRHFISDDSGNVSIKASFYDGMYPLIKFVLVLAVLAVDLVPFAAVAGLYSLVISNGVAINVVEQFIWLVVFVIGTVISLWLVTRNLFALYIVTLPGAMPKQSLQDSWRITKQHQYKIARKLVLLVAFVLCVGGILLVPIIAVAAPLTSAALFIFSMLLLPFAHVYLYGAYRELLR